MNQSTIYLVYLLGVVAPFNAAMADQEQPQGENVRNLRHRETAAREAMESARRTEVERKAMEEASSSRKELVERMRAEQAEKKRSLRENSNSLPDPCTIKRLPECD